jgi:hypothetical protein
MNFDPDGAHRPATGEEMDMKSEQQTIQPLSSKARLQRSHASRSGSALLIVIGTLALISVFAAVYISIGRTDRRAANAVSTRNSLADTSERFGEALSTIIGNDRLDAVMQYDGDRGNSFGRREVTDAPGTDWSRRSESTFRDGRDLFTPVGGPFFDGGLNQTTDFSVASDPWLASTTPVYLGNPGISNVDRPFSTVDPFNPNFPNAKNFLDNRDWLQISNFAPDGRFVNLFNLRPTAAFGDTSVFGRFDAEPGSGVTTHADGRSIRRMSSYLSLWKKEIPDLPTSRIQAFDPELEGIWVPGQNTPISGVIPSSELFITPAAWTMYQRFMFMPMNQPFITINRQGAVSTWADPDFPAYQYADADGDGMADSRWFELVSAHDALDGLSSEPRTDIEVQYDRKDYRYFLAARAVDLSSMVNVNTATDSLVPPTTISPLGLTPADVDLRRLLTMQDPAGDYTANGNNLPLSLAQLHRPYIGQVGVEPRFGPWIPAAAGGYQQRNLNRNVSDYWLYKHEFDRATGGTDIRQIENSSTSMLVGRYAYDALRQGIKLGSSLSDDYTGFDYAFSSPSRREHMLQYERDPSDQGTIPRQITAALRVKQFQNVGQLDPTNLGNSWSRGTEFGSGLYGMDELTELLTFHGLNDPEVNSRLEQVTTGRYKSPRVGTADDILQTQRLGPLMSNRPLILDRYQHGLAMIDITRDPSTAPSATDRALREINGRISFNSMAHFALTPRNKLTPISGSVPLRATEFVEDAATLEPMTAETAAIDLIGAMNDPQKLFSIYSAALAGELKTPDNFFATPTYWPLDPNQYQRNLASTLFYGHRGPELALRIAAHTAVNMKDMADSDDVPTVATLILDNSIRNELITTYANTPSNTNRMYNNYPGRAMDLIFDPGFEFLSNGRFTGQQNHRQAVNVFGFEKMPILTEVSSMYVYADSDQRNGEGLGNVDYSPGRPILQSNGLIRIPAQVNIKINGDVIPSNSDMKMQVLAFQLTNPWDVSITIGNPGAGGRMGVLDEPNRNNINLRFDYYIEYGGRFFKLGEFVEFNPPDNRYGDGVLNPPPLNTPITSAFPEYQYRGVTIPAQSSRVFYAIADGRFDGAEGAPSRNIDSNWFDEIDFGGGSFVGSDGQPWTGAAEEWVNKQFKVRGGGAAVHIHQFDPRSGVLVEQNGFVDLFQPSTTPVFNSSDRAPDFKQARLWRKIKGNLEEVISPNLPVGSTRVNRIQNDMLVDRLSASNVSFFERNLAAGDNPVLGTYGYDNILYPQVDADQLGVRNDNFGLSIVRWATVRRGDNPQGTGAINPAPGNDVGKIASWMMSSRLGSFNTVESTDPYPDDGSGLDVSHFLVGTFADLGNNPRANPNAEPDYEVHKTFADLFNPGVGPALQEVIQTITRLPKNKYRIVDGGAQQQGGLDFSTRFPTMYLGATLYGQTLHQSGGKLVPEMSVEQPELTRSPRLADLLLAWGVGPTYTPDPTRSAANISFDEIDEGKRWITLPEAIAIGLGYRQVTSYTASESEAESVWKDTFLTDQEKVLDNGHLVIDNFVSYVNTNPAVVPPAFNPLIDIPRGTGAPMALGVIDQARANAPIAQVTDSRTTSASDLLERALTKATFGKININTAPIEVLRLLPGLTPSRASYISASGLETEWLGSNPTYFDLNLPNLSLTDPSKNPDVAAAIIAYRDRTYAVPNTAAKSRNSPFYDERPFNLGLTRLQSNPSLLARNMREEAPSRFIPAGNTPITRSTMTGIDGLRSSPGFGSLGELLAVRVDPAMKTSDAVRWANTKHLSIQQYASDEIASGLVTDPGGNKVTFQSQIFEDVTQGTTAGTTKDDYAEKLSMANAVLNTLSVRSDYFAVWFVVQGYQESDVANLRPEDPMVPSIRKRFLMVVDRTNVIKPGDKPKILVFKEIPI